MVFWKKYHDSQLSSGYLVTHWPSYEIQPLELQFYHWLIQSIASHPTPNRINALLGVVNKWMKVRWSWWLVKLNVVSKFVMIALPLRNDGRQWLSIQSKEFWAQEKALRNPVMYMNIYKAPNRVISRKRKVYEGSFAKRPGRWRWQIGICQTNTIKTTEKPCQICQTSRASEQGECCGPTYWTRLTNRVWSKWIPGFRQHYQEGSS